MRSFGSRRRPVLSLQHRNHRDHLLLPHCGARCILHCCHLARRCGRLGLAIGTTAKRLDVKVRQGIGVGAPTTHLPHARHHSASSSPWSIPQGQCEPPVVLRPRRAWTTRRRLGPQARATPSRSSPAPSRHQRRWSSCDLSCLFRTTAGPPLDPPPPPHLIASAAQGHLTV